MGTLTQPNPTEPQVNPGSTCVNRTREPQPLYKRGGSGSVALGQLGRSTEPGTERPVFFPIPDRECNLVESAGDARPGRAEEAA